MERTIRLGISSCLLGEQVRYDGGHKLDHFLSDTLGRYVEWVPVCPEVECGLSAPREAMRLIGDAQSPRLVTRKTGVDYTEQMLGFARNKIRLLEKKDLCGFVFKAGSPSSGMRGVKVYPLSGVPVRNGVGIFARQFMDHFPFMPVEDDGRLHNPDLRENFIERIFVFRRWKNLLKTKRPASELVSFHTEHKLLLMAHSPVHLLILGRIVAGAKKYRSYALYTDYLKNLMEGLRLRATVKKNVNVLQHIAGYLKKQLSGNEKQELQEVITQYHHKLIPLIVPVVLLKHYVRKYREPYLSGQYYLDPHPLELMLRNHV